MDDHKIIALFNERSEQAITELSKKYGRACMNVAINVLGNESDAEECVNDAYLALWNSVPPKYPDYLLAYLLKIVRNLALKKKRSDLCSKRSSLLRVPLSETEDFLALADTIQDHLDEKELTTHIDSFLASIDTESRIIFIRRYWFCDSVEAIAERLHKKPHYISVKLSRTKEKLKKSLRKEGFEL